MARHSERRRRYLATRFRVFIPADDPPHRALATLIPGSAIVAPPGPDAHPDTIVVDVEGDRYPTQAAGRYADLVKRAAGRAFERYPTIARLSVPRAALTEIASFDPLEDRVWVHAGHDRLRAWILQRPTRALPAADLDADLTCNSLRAAQRQNLREAIARAPDQRHALRQHARRLGHDDLV